ncbi:MAG: transcription antitermination factor NusB [Bacilli bacterium]|nr:transcription antitermination factor NusB [Bacilli bacterium]
MKNRSELREIIIKVIYQTYILKNTNLKYNIDKLVKDQLEVENEYVSTCVNGIIDNRTKIDSLANKYLKDWTIDRLNNVDKSILSLGIYELMYTDTPSIVCINEAVELSKKYSEEKVTKMINGVLDNIYHSEVEDER